MMKNGRKEDCCINQKINNLLLGVGDDMVVDVMMVDGGDQYFLIKLMSRIHKYIFFTF
jgi:hypothetical protein